MTYFGGTEDRLSLTSNLLTVNYGSAPTVTAQPHDGPTMLGHQPGEIQQPQGAERLQPPTPVERSAYPLLGRIATGSTPDSMEETSSQVSPSIARLKREAEAIVSPDPETRKRARAALFGRMVASGAVTLSLGKPGPDTSRA